MTSMKLEYVEMMLTSLMAEQVNKGQYMCELYLVMTHN